MIQASQSNSAQMEVFSASACSKPTQKPYLPYLIRDLLYADDCILVAHSLSDAQQLFDQFREAACHFVLKVSLKKTKVMMQPSPNSVNIPPVIRAGNISRICPLHSGYLGSILANTANSESDITARLAKASSAFGRLTNQS